MIGRYTTGAFIFANMEVFIKPLHDHEFCPIMAERTDLERSLILIMVLLHTHGQWNYLAIRKGQSWINSMLFALLMAATIISVLIDRSSVHSTLPLS